MKRVLPDTAWQDAGLPRARQSLTGDLRANIVVVGGGLAGILTAYYLAAAGEEVLVLEKDIIGLGVTAFTTAFLMQAIDTPLSELARTFGIRKARNIWRSHRAAIDEAERLVRLEGIVCDFERVDSYIYANNEKEWHILQNDHAWAERLGFESRLRRDNDLPFRNTGYLRLPDQAKFHPLKFLFGLATRAERRGALILEHSGVTGIRKQRSWVLTTARGKVLADRIIITTHFPFRPIRSSLLKKESYTTYILEAKIPSDILPDALFLDVSKPYHYFRVDPMLHHDRLLFGGADHNSSIKVSPSRGYRTLHQYLDHILLDVPYVLSRHWTGPILGSLDGLALIGEIKTRELIATAFSRNGMTYAILAGQLLSDLARGKRNEWQKLYDPRRTSIPGLLSKIKDYPRSHENAFRISPKYHDL